MEEQRVERIPLIGEPAPHFEAETTNGPISFPEDYKGKWIVLFSHPADFTPVCTTEFMTFARMQEEFDELNTQLVGLSVDGLQAHIAWIRSMKDINFRGEKGADVKFPVIVDISMNVSEKYGMIQPEQSSTSAVRAVFVIDPEGVIRTILYYPQELGRNFDEIKRIVQGLQKADEGYALPADWRPGEDVIVPPANTVEMAEERANLDTDDMRAEAWWLVFTPDKDKK